VDDETKAKVTVGVEKIREALKGEDAEAIKSTMQELEQVMHGAAQQMYESASEGEAGAGGPGDGAPGDGATAEDTAKKKEAKDADFEVVED